MEDFKPTHKGFFLGIVPVYLDMTNADCPTISERHWSLAPLGVVVDVLFAAFVWVATTINPHYEPTYPIMITGEITR